MGAVEGERERVVEEGRRQRVVEEGRRQRVGALDD